MPTRKEINWVIEFSIFVIIITTIPYILAYFSQGDNWRFSGFLFGVEDGNSYIAKMLSGANGEILFKTPYTILNQPGFIAFLPYLLMGKLTSIPGQHEQLVALFHIFRWGGIFFLCLTSYYFISLLLTESFYRKSALVISILGGGLGWISLLWNHMPLEIYSPETFGFLSVFGIPHLLYSKGLLLLGLYGFLAWEHKVRTAWIMIGFFQPLTIVIGWFVLFTYLIVWTANLMLKKDPDFFFKIKNESIYIAIIGLISSPWVFYNAISFQIDPFLKGWYNQNVILSPSPIDYFFSIGLIAPLAIWGILILYKLPDRKFIFSLGWLLIFPILVYFPILVQRRLAEGFWTFFVALMFVPFMEKQINKKVVFAATFVFFISALILFSGGLMASINPQGPVFIPKTEMDAFGAIGKVSKNWDVVLGPYQASNAIAAWIPVRVLAGHGPESVNLKQVELDIEQFNRTSDDKERLQFINQNKINFILSSPDNHALDGKPFTQKIFGNRDYVVYQIIEK